MWASLGVLLMAIAFAITAIAFVQLLHRSSTMLRTTAATTSRLESDLDQTIVELERVLEETGQTAVDVEQKLVATNGLFRSIQELGQATELFTGEVKAQTEKFNTDGSQPGTLPFIRLIQFSEFGFGLFRSWKRGKKASMKGQG